MKKYTKEIIAMIFIIGLVISSGMMLTKIFAPQNKGKIDTPVLAVNTSPEKTKVSKLETEDYYYYMVEDHERNLSYSWKFQKDKKRQISVEESLNIDVDLRLSLDAFTKDTEAISSRVDQKKLIISFDHHGTLPLEATVRINVSDKFKEHERLYLYYYNPEKDQIEYIDHNVKVEDGYVEFTIDHCSDYFLTGAVVNDAVGNPKNINYIIIGLIVVVFILVAVTLVQSKNK